MTHLRHGFECPDCGLIYTVERLNMVSGDPKAVLEHYCPNCGGENITER
jgi:predicted RNA-binding Zn-ribbon protein involved in translation (DUF1610 family)